MDDPTSEGLVTFPDEHNDGDLQLELMTPDEQMQNQIQNAATNGMASDTVKFEQKRMMNSSKTKILSNGFSSEKVR